jgi:integrase
MVLAVLTRHGSWHGYVRPDYRAVMAPAGYVQQLPSGSFRVSVYAGTDPLTGRQIRLRKTCKTERAAQIELGKLLEQATAGRQPETNATVAQLMDQYVEVADWDLSTRKANEVYIRRVIKPALGHLQVRKLRGCSTCCTRS